MSLKRSATVDSSDSEDRQAVPLQSGCMYYYDTWFNAVHGQKTMPPTMQQAPEIGADKGSEKTTDSQEFPRPQPAKLGVRRGVVS